MKSSQPDIEFRQLTDYVFGKLSEKEEMELEALLDRNPHYADIVEGIRSFALDRNILTLEKFEQAWNAEFGSAGHTIELSSRRSASGAVKLVIGITTGLALGYFLGRTNTLQLIINNQRPQIDSQKRIIAGQDSASRHSSNEDSLRLILNNQRLQIDSLKRIIAKQDSALHYSSPPVPEPPFRLDRELMLYEFWKDNRDMETGGAGTPDSLSWLKPFKSEKFRKQDLVNSLRILEGIPEKEATTQQKYYRGCLTFLLRPEENDATIRLLEQSRRYRSYAQAFLFLARQERQRHQ